MKLRTVSLVDALTDTLRTRVLDGEVDPGAGLTENDVAAEYDVSRPTAKAAIATLVQQGLLRREPHKSARVPVLTEGDVEDLFRVRLPLELAVVHALMEQEQVPRAAAEAVDALAHVPLDARHSVFVHADLGFHRALVEAVGSPRLSRVYGDLSGEIHLSMIQNREALGRDRIAAEHRGVLQAMERGDGPVAEQLMRRHLEGACAALVERLRPPA
ncbi:GntR family transcriptional regulator [Phycicoccus endophyticus]|uniref:GntR family transcriptional regulator n=1 Tax=Phycicoccus endophyticus TaxID=1690220 RepID=A0A7G9R2X2_9MICO|nr:GntR family transcriptional regulator [Phycicoccus endophyticus]NHI20235.1 GntR family transcriptional regulator [Phycicoccus endophyticus]QNN49947.1 GntR family transcriptional regulator [Phycicoccus endophyticus]GGL29368.1 GntR family transcriptional regulator [Phycicoccus endophyticus]